MKRLEYLATRLNTSKAQVIKQAIDKLYEEESKRSKKSALDILSENNFEPLEIEPLVNAHDEEAQRNLIREKLSKKNRD